MARPEVTRALERRPLAWSIVLTVVWVTVIHVLGQVLVAGRTGTAGALWAAAVNAVALVVPLAVVSVTGWRARAGVSGSLLGPRWYVLVPIAAVAVAWLGFGVAPRAASAIMAAALLQLVLGLNEETTFRGVIQGIWAQRRVVERCVVVGTIFGVQHASNLL